MSVADACHQRELRVAAVLDQKTRVAHVLLAAHAFEIGLPAFAVGWIRQHEVELPGRKGVVGERGMLRAAHNVVGGFALALEQQVRLADRKGLRVDLLAVQVRGNLLVALGSEFLQRCPRPLSACRRCRRRRRRAGKCRIRSGRRRAGRRAWPSAARRRVESSVRPLLRCSPRLKRRTSSSKMVPIPWLSRLGRRTAPPASTTGSGLKLISREVSFSINAPSASALDRREIWLRNSKLPRMSCTLGENPSSQARKSASRRWRLARARRSRRVNGETL